MTLNCEVLSDNIEYMKSMADNSVDLVMTSPPYAEQRKNTYGGISEDKYVEWFIPIAKEIYRVLKPSGSFVLNIKEHASDGVRSLYTYELVIALAKVFRFSDTFIWHKINPFPMGGNKRLKDGFEYCFWFTKSNDYKFYPNNVLEPSKSKSHEAEKLRSGDDRSYEKGSTENYGYFKIKKRFAPDMVRPSNVLSMKTDCSSHEHSATFPIELPEFFIKLMTDKDDLVFDPFSGSGTTLVAAKGLGRNYTGCDIVEKYVNIANNRLDNVFVQENMFDIVKE